ncbi:MAG: radical SAM protein [Candidatus Nanoarchaeia archaeon]
MEDRNLNSLWEEYARLFPKRSVFGERSLCWHVTYLCNLDCSFCDAKKSNERIQKQVDFLKNNWRLYKKGFEKLPGSWEIILTGGEALALPGILGIVKDLVEMGHKISLTTNFSFSLDFYKKFLKIVDGKLHFFSASFKPEYYKLEPYLKKAQDINTAVKRMNGHFTVVAVAEPKWLDYLYNVGKMFNKKGIKYRLQAKRVNGSYIKYSKREKEKISEFTRCFGLGKDVKLKSKGSYLRNEPSLNGFYNYLEEQDGSGSLLTKNLFNKCFKITTQKTGSNCFKGSLCLAGIKYFVMDDFGNCFRCHSGITHISGNQEYMGNLLKGGVRFFNNPKPCPHNSCSCILPYDMGLII